MLSVLKSFGHGDKAAFRYMEGYEHCEYDDKPFFLELLLCLWMENLKINDCPKPDHR